MTELTYTMLATMGGQPQVVTFALDALLRQGFRISDVFVLHLMPQADIGRLNRALERLSGEFAGQRYGGQPCRLHLSPLYRDAQRLDDIRDEAAASAAWNEIYQRIAEMKAQNRHLHVCITGGRRMLAVLAMSAALLHFDHDDRLWHMYTPPEFLERARDGAVMHARPEDGVQLIRVPLVPWGVYFPGLRAMTQASPLEALDAQGRRLEAEERRPCQEVVAKLRERPLRALREFASGKNPQAVAEAMCVTVKTVHAHKTEIFQHCRNAWNLPETERLPYHFLREKFGRYFEKE